MPLLGKRIFYCVKPLTDLKEGEQVYTIPHTKERFRSKAEYEKRLDLYDQRIWQCQCTGHLSLTHEEAWNSERAVKQSLADNFSECYEKPVLEIVHHNTVALESLVDQAWLKVQQVLCIGEKVCLKIKKGGQLIKGTVVGIDTSGVEANPTSNCSSPSSDKENTTSVESGDTGSPKKWVPPKLLPYKYSVNLTEEDKIINGIPAAELTRIDRPPPKEFIRLFIRASALRHGTTSTSPWVVNDDLVAKYHLPSKFADFLLSPSKMAEAAKRAEEEMGKKRKLVKKPSTASAKKLKTDKGDEKKARKRKLKDGDAKPRKNGATPSKRPKLFKSPKKDKPKSGDSASKSESPKKKKSKSNDVIVIESESSDDEIVLATLKKKSSVDEDSDSDVPLANLTNHTPKKASPKKAKKDKDTPRSKGAKSPVKKPKEQKDKSPVKKKREQKDKSPVKKKAKAMANDTTVKKRGRPKKNAAEKEKEKGKKTPGQRSPKKSMKQLTLLDMSKGKDQSAQEKTPRKSSGPAKAASPGTPAIAKKLIKLKKADEKIKFGQLLKKAALSLTSAQRKHLPLEIRDLVQKKYEKIEEKKLLDKMGPEEREAYMKVKREKLRIQQMETQRLKRKRFDERDLTLTPLPTPKMVVTPEGLPNEAFGDVAMVTELINCYSGLLMPQDEYPIFADALMKALCGGTKGFTYLCRVVVVLLQTLLQDESAEDYKELRVALADIPLNAYTASEMVRLCLRRQDQEDDGNLEDHDVPDAVVQQLEEKEFYQLSPLDKLEILKALSLRILGTYSVQDYMEEKQKEATSLVKQKVAGQKEMNEKLKESKEKLKQAKGQSKDDANGPKASSASANGTDSNGKTEEKGAGEEKPSDGTDLQEVDDDNLVSIVRRRRLMAAKAAAEKERLEKERRILREKEAEEERLRRDKENFDKMFKEGILLAKMVLRQSPLGTDRDHNRYWTFTNTTPGFFVERGWVTKDMEYSVEPPSPTKSESGVPSLPTTPSKQGSHASLPATPAKPGRKRKGDLANSRRVSDEEIFCIPEPGPNQWFCYESVKDLDMLVEALHPQGFRESMLRAELKKNYDIVSRSILSAQRTNNELRDSDGDTELMEGLKKEMVEMELRLRNGGLGGVPDYEKWESKVLAATDIKTLGPCLVQMQGSILDKFLQGFMKPVAKKTQEKVYIDGETKEEPENEEEDEDEEEEVGKKDARTRAIEAWQEAVRGCQTLSRLHVLVGMLDSCVKWEKSAENAKCKICRKKCDDDRLLLCDECNQAFHMYCLRPQLVTVPRGDWYCPACVPMTRRRVIDPGRSYKEASTDDDDEEEDDEEKEENCQECGGDEGLIFCSECPAAYHPECHDPPLRHPPRGRWVCTNCKTGRGRKTRSGRKSSHALRTRRPPHKKRNISEDEESEEEEDEDEEDVSDEEEAEEVREAVQRSTRETSRQSRSGRPSRSSRSPRVAAREEAVVDSYGPSRTSKRPPSELSICENILSRLVKHKLSWPFLERVDKREVPDYYTIIRHPMDFQTIRLKLGRLSYSSAQEFVQDVNLVFRNAEEYNKRDSEVYQCMVELEKFFMEQLSKQLPYSASTMAAYNGFADTSGSQRRRLRR